MKKRLRMLCAVLCAAVLFSGCSSIRYGSVQVEELLRAPQLSGDYGELQAALNEWLGESAQLRYPLNGELLSPFLMSDWDGDGVQDAAVLYTVAQLPNVCLAILQRDDAGKWQVCGSVEGLSDTVESVRFAKLQDIDADQIVVGYSSSQGDEYLAVYAYKDGAVETILEEPYGQYLIEDITGTGHEDLVLLSTDEEGAVQIELLTADRDGSFQQVAVTGLSPDRFTGCASLAVGTGADGGHYLVLDGWTGASGTNLASVLLYFNEETQQMEQAHLIDADTLYEASLRNVPTLTSRDLNGDGIVEIPTQPVQAGQISLSQSRRVDFIVWMDYTSRRPKKSFGLLDEEYGFYLELPAAWEGNLLLTDGEEEGVMELRDLTGELLYMSLRVAGLTENSDGWTRLGLLASRQVQVRLEPDADIRQGSYRLSRALYIL